MSKKYTWIIALFVVMTAVFMGCQESKTSEKKISEHKDLGPETGMKPTLYGNNQPIWDNKTESLMIIADSSTGFTFTWAQLGFSYDDVKEKKVTVVYAINVIKPEAVLTVKNLAVMTSDLENGANWGAGKGREYLLGSEQYSNISDQIANSGFNQETKRGWFDIHMPFFPSTATGIGFVHNYWATYTGNTAKIAENSEYQLKILSIRVRCCTDSDCDITTCKDCIDGNCINSCGNLCCTEETDNPELTGSLVLAGPSVDVKVGQTLTATFTPGEGETSLSLTYTFLHNSSNVQASASNTYNIPLNVTAAGTYMVKISVEGHAPKDSNNVTVSVYTFGGTVAITKPADDLVASYAGADSAVVETLSCTYEWKKYGVTDPAKTTATFENAEAGAYTVTMRAPGYTPITSQSFIVLATSEMLINDPAFTGWGGLYQTSSTHNFGTEREHNCRITYVFPTGIRQVYSHFEITYALTRSTGANNDPSKPMKITLSDRNKDAWSESPSYNEYRESNTNTTTSTFSRAITTREQLTIEHNTDGNGSTSFEIKIISIRFYNQ